MKLKIFCFLLLIPFTIFAQNREHAFEINAQLGRGINLSMFEANTNSVTVSKWNPEYPKMIADLGFNHIRIPIRWEPTGRSNPNAPYTINPDFLAQIKQIIDSCLNNGLMAIIDMHHHEALFADPDEQKDRFLSQWRQISSFFKDYPNKLLFEILNEPHSNLKSDKWNVLLDEALSAIREDSPGRTVLIGTADWGGLGSISDLKLPDDENIILTIHYYNPFYFTHQGASWVSGADAWLGTKWNDTDAEREIVRNNFAPLKEMEKEQKIPIHIGEFGSYNKADDASRKKWTTYIARFLESQDWSWAYWEFCEGFGIYNASSQSYYQFLVDALLHDSIPEPAYYAQTPVYTSDFSKGNSEWDLRNSSGAVSSKQNTNDQMIILISTAGTSGWHIQLVKYGIKLEAGKQYRVRFKASADINRSIVAYVGEGAEPWGAYSNYESISLVDTVKEYSYTFNMTKNDNNARIKFDLGSSDTDVCFESIVLESIELQDPTSAIITKEFKTKIFPNPVINQLAINNFDQFEQLTITNINGSTILSKNLYKQSDKINCSQLAPGIYFVTLQNHNNRYTRKIIKK